MDDHGRALPASAGCGGAPIGEHHVVGRAVQEPAAELAVRRLFSEPARRNRPLFGTVMAKVPSAVVVTD